MLTKNIRAYFELGLAMSLVGSSVVVGKLITASFPVFLAGGLRFAIASVILVPLLWKREGSLTRSIVRRDWCFLFLQSLCGTFLFSVFLLYGLRLTSAAEGGIITSTTPAVLGIISFVWLKEQLHVNKVLGISLSVLGIVAVNVLGDSLGQERGSIPLLGNLLVLGAVVGEALFTIFRKLITEKITALAITTWMSLFGLALFLPFAVHEAHSFDFSAVGAADWSTMLYYGVVVTVVAFLLWFSGLSKVQAGTAAVFTGMIPVSALILSYLLLGEAFSWTHVLGCLCVLAGIGFMTKPPRFQHRKNQPYLHNTDSVSSMQS